MPFLQTRANNEGTRDRAGGGGSDCWTLSCMTAAAAAAAVRPPPRFAAGCPLDLALAAQVAGVGANANDALAELIETDVITKLLF